MSEAVNVVSVKIGSNREEAIASSPVHEFDTGVYVNFIDEVPTGSKCEFDSKTKSYDSTVANSVCALPDALLNEDCPGDIHGHLMVYGRETDRYTTYDFVIPVLRILRFPGVTPEET